MSQFTNYAENKIADFIRGQGLTLPANWYIAAGSAGTDAGITELTSVGLSRATKARSLANFAGTQGAGTTLASSGTSKATSNNNAISFGTPSGSGTMTHIGFFDAASSGNCWIWVPVTSVPFTAGSPSPLQIDTGALALSLGLLGGATHYLVNKMIDLLFRAQAFTWPSTIYPSYFTVAPTDAGGGTEAAGGGYARASITSDTTSLSGTQAAGSTSASSGSGGRISNNAAVAHPAPSGSQGDVVATGVHDAATSGNLLWWKLLSSPVTVASGGPAPTYQPDTLGITLA